MARQSKNVEFLNTLFELSGLRSEAQFARRCGQAAPNMHNYLHGKLNPGKTVLARCLDHLFAWPVTRLAEIERLPKLKSIPSDSGIYVIYDSGGQVLYIGKAKNLRSELAQTLNRRIPVGMRRGPTLKKTQPKIRELAHFVSLYSIASPRSRSNFEALLLRVFANQTHNTNIATLPME